MKKQIIILIISVLSILMLAGCGCEHEWNEGTCNQPMTCSLCGASESEPLGHQFMEATCDLPMTCSRCGASEGSALGHRFENATCTKPGTCVVCNQSRGDLLPHTPGEAQTETDLITAIRTESQSCTACGTILSKTETVISLVGDGAFLLSMDDFVKRLNYIYEQNGESDFSASIDYATNGEQPFLRVSYRGVGFLVIDFFVRDPDPITFSRMTKEHMDDPVIKEVFLDINYWAFVGYAFNDPDIPEENILAMCELYEDDAFSTRILAPIYTVLDPTLTADQINASILRGRHELKVTDTREYYYNEKCGDLYVEYVDFFTKFYLCSVSIVTSEDELVFPFE